MRHSRKLGDSPIESEEDAIGDGRTTYKKKDKDVSENMIQISGAGFCANKLHLLELEFGMVLLEYYYAPLYALMWLYDCLTCCRRWLVP